jgi:hypothetical protein
VERGEELARQWFEPLSGLRAELCDTGSQDGQVDYLIEDASGTIGALEVTRHMDPQWRERQALIDKRCDGEGY